MLLAVLPEYLHKVSCLSADTEGSYVEEHDSLVSQQSLVRVAEEGEEDEGSTDRHSLPSDAAGAQRRSLVSASQTTMFYLVTLQWPLEKILS